MGDDELDRLDKHISEYPCDVCSESAVVAYEIRGQRAVACRKHSDEVRKTHVKKMSMKASVK